jgi:hypothetical protein
MLPLGLNAADAATFTSTLGQSHSIYVTVQVLDLNHNRLADISDRLIDGQVNLDVTQDVTMSASLQLLDPRRALHFDSDSPGNGALFLDRMLRLIYSVKCPSPLGWVHCPVFTGPVSKLDRQDDVITVECQGKESLALGAGWVPKTWKKGHHAVQVIRQLLSELAGETKFSFPETNHRLPKDFSIGRETEPWLAAKNVAQAINMDLFYDARGVARLRTRPGQVTYHFAHGDGGTVMTEPQVTYTLDGVRNIVWVKGGVPKGETQAISYWLTAAKTHPLSPQKLGRNGVPRYLLDTVTNTNIRSLSDAKALAQKQLASDLLEHIDVAFEALPVPHLEGYDVVKLTTSEFGMPFKLTQYSLPLGTGSNMTVGYTDVVKGNAAAIRRVK